MNRFVTGLAALAVLTSTPAEAGSFKLILDPAPPELQGVYEYAAAAPFDEIVGDLNSFVNLPRDVVIRFASSPAGPYYLDHQIVMSYEFLAVNDELFAEAGYNEDEEDAADNLLALAEFVLYHEVAHALVDVLDVPVLGKEEDAADSLAALMASAFDLSGTALVAADAFAIASEAAGEFHEAEFWDSHSLNEQRMYAIVCLIYGGNPEELDGLLYDVGMEGQEERCTRDFQERFDSWDRFLRPHLKE